MRLGLSSGGPSLAAPSSPSLVALVIGLFVSRRVTRPLRGMEDAARRMAEGDLAQAVPVAGTDEIAALGIALNRTAVALREKIERLGDEQAKVRTILDGMTEGVVALDDRGRLLLLNPAARAMFRWRTQIAEGRPFLEVIRQKELLDLVYRGARLRGPGPARARAAGLPSIAWSRRAARPSASGRRRPGCSWFSTTSPSSAGSSGCAPSSWPTCPTS